MPASKAIGQINSQLLDQVSKYLLDAESRSAMHLLGTGAVAALERKIASYYGMKHALCVTNATAGLFALALALDLKKAVFATSPYTYGASLASWLFLGNKPCFTDIDAETLTLDPDKAKKRMTAKTKAILAVDILGNPSDTVRLRKLADEFGLWYIADCAQSFGARRDGFPASHLADALVVSFTTGKTLFAGEGGAVVTDRTDLYEKLVWLTQHPYRQKRELGLSVFNVFGISARIHPLAAVWANSGFDDAMAKLETYQKACLDLLDELNGNGLIEPVRFKEKNIVPSFFRLTAELKENVSPEKAENYLSARAQPVKTAPAPLSVIYQTAAFTTQFKGRFLVPENCLVAERQAHRRITLTGVK